MNPQRVTNLLLDPETLNEIDSIAAEWFAGNRSEALRHLLSDGLTAWGLGIRDGAQIRRVDAEQWQASVVSAIQSQWPESAVSIEFAGVSGIQGEPKTPISAVAYRLRFARENGKPCVLIAAAEGMAPDYFVERVRILMGTGGLDAK
jgi:hypothetical protein